MFKKKSPKIRELAERHAACYAGTHQNNYRAMRLANSPLGEIQINDLTVTDLSRYRDERVNRDGIAAQTFHHEINMLRAVIRTARIDWGMHHVRDHAETFSLLKMPKIDGERDRRLLPGEWEALPS